MNKLFLLIAASALSTSPFSVFAQTATLSSAPVAVEAAKSAPLVRFNLDFPGGTPTELAASISRATKKHLNLIVPKSHANAQIMPIRVENVTVADLFSAIEAASLRQVPVVNSRGMGGQKSVQYQSVGLSFTTKSKEPTDDSVWSFISTEPTAEDMNVLKDIDVPDQQVCQYFQLAPYLQDHSIEDITTAIQTGWKMLKVDPVPQLSFHEETKLLIAVGSATHVAQIPAVLAQLPLDNSIAVEKVAKWQAELEEIEAGKGTDWEKKAQEKRGQIERAARIQKARETIQNAPQPIQRPQVVPAPLRR